MEEDTSQINYKEDKLITNFKQTPKMTRHLLLKHHDVKSLMFLVTIVFIFILPFVTSGKLYSS